jgi:hypothetical protein
VRANQTVRKNRGLQSFFPLERLIADYYDPFEPKERWLQFHNLFAHLYNLKETGTEVGCNQEQVADTLKADFEAFVSQIWPKRKKKKIRKKLKVKAPTLEDKAYIYADLLSRTEAELKEHELHSNFDYLAFFRAAFTLVAQIRNAVLFDSRRNLLKIDGDSETTSNFYLLDRLLYGLRVEPQNKNFAILGNEVSKDVIPLNQLKAISRSLKTFIKDAGSSGLKDAEKFMDLSTTHPATQTIPPEKTAGPSYGVYHRLTYHSTVLRTRRRNVSLTRFLSLKLNSTKRTKKIVKWSNFIGKKKRRVVFTCFGDCPFGTAAKFLKLHNDYLSPEERSELGMYTRPRRLFKLLRKVRNWHIPATVDLIEGLDSEDNGAPVDASDDEWETVSVDIV